MTDQQTLATILDGCVEDVLLGTATVEECLDRWPEHRDELAGPLRAAVAVSRVPVPDVQPDPARRAAFMAELRTTPQKRARFRIPSLPAFDFSNSMLRFASVAAPAAVVAVIALMLVWGGSSSTASAATLTVFAGSVEQQVDGDWQPVADGATLDEGATIRTLGAALAMLTFPDGSTATVDASTQVELDRISVNGERMISLRQVTGRIWNDVVPIQQGDSYVIHTPHAVVAAHGTVFATVVDGETSVLTAEGLVSLAQADFRVDVLAGQVVRATAGSISAPESAPSIGEIRVDGPVAAYLTSPQGAATGVLMNGLVFRQIPGITTMATEGLDHTKLQRIVLGDAEEGEYALVLRRYAPGEGTVIVETPAGIIAVEIPENVAIARLPLAVNATGDGTLELLALNTELESVGEVPPVRVVETKRSRQAEMPEATPRATEPPAAAATEASEDATSNAERDPEGTRPAAPEGTRAAEASSAQDSWAGRLQDALARGDDRRLKEVLDEVLEADDDATRATRLGLLTAVMSDPSAAARIRAQADRRLIEKITTEASELTPGLADGLRSGFAPPLPAAPDGREPPPRGDDNRPGNSGNAPGNGGSDRGNSGNTPGNSGGAPGSGGSDGGNSGNAPGSGGSDRGNSGNEGRGNEGRGNEGRGNSDRGNDERSPEAPRQSEALPGDRQTSRTPGWLQQLLDVLRQGRSGDPGVQTAVATPTPAPAPSAATVPLAPPPPIPTPTPMAALRATATPTVAPRVTATPTVIPRATATATPTPTPTPTPASIATPTPSATEAPSPGVGGTEDATPAATSDASQLPPTPEPMPAPEPDYPWWWPWWWR